MGSTSGFRASEPRSASNYACFRVNTGPDPHPDQEIHRRMDLLMSRLDEQQRRWYAAVESAKLGHGGDCQVSRITGLHVETIRRGREERADTRGGRLADRV